MKLAKARIRTLALFLLALALVAPAAAQVTAVDSVSMTVSDMDRAVAFYSGVLTFEQVSDV